MGAYGASVTGPGFGTFSGAGRGGSAAAVPAAGCVCASPWNTAHAISNAKAGAGIILSLMVVRAFKGSIYLGLHDKQGAIGALLSKVY